MKVLKFSASWCGPCKQLSMTLEELKGLGLIPVEEVDVDQFSGLAREFNIRGVPTLVKMLDGKEIDRKSGNLTKEQLKEFLGG